MFSLFLVNVGVFGDMRKFFDELKTNLDVTEAASPSHEMNVKEENPEAQGIYIYQGSLFSFPSVTAWIERFLYIQFETPTSI